MVVSDINLLETSTDYCSCCTAGTRHKGLRSAYSSILVIAEYEDFNEVFSRCAGANHAPEQMPKAKSLGSPWRKYAK